MWVWESIWKIPRSLLSGEGEVSLPVERLRSDGEATLYNDQELEVISGPATGELSSQHQSSATETTHQDESDVVTSPEVSTNQEVRESERREDHREDAAKLASPEYCSNDGLPHALHAYGDDALLHLAKYEGDRRLKGVHEYSEHDAEQQEDFEGAPLLIEQVDVEKEEGVISLEENILPTQGHRQEDLTLYRDDGVSGDAGTQGQRELADAGVTGNQRQSDERLHVQLERRSRVLAFLDEQQEMPWTARDGHSSAPASPLPLAIPAAPGQSRVSALRRALLELPGPFSPKAARSARVVDHTETAREPQQPRHTIDKAVQIDSARGPNPQLVQDLQAFFNDRTRGHQQHRLQQAPAPAPLPLEAQAAPCKAKPPGSPAPEPGYGWASSSSSSTPEEQQQEPCPDALSANRSGAGREAGAGVVGAERRHAHAPAPPEPGRGRTRAYDTMEDKCMECCVYYSVRCCECTII